MFNSWEPIDSSLPGPSGHGISRQVLEWVAISFPSGSSQLRNQTHISCIADLLYQLSYKGSPPNGWGGDTQFLNRLTVFLNAFHWLGASVLVTTQSSNAHRAIAGPGDSIILSKNEKKICKKCVDHSLISSFLGYWQKILKWQWNMNLVAYFTLIRNHFSNSVNSDYLHV